MNTHPVPPLTQTLLPAIDLNSQSQKKKKKDSSGEAIKIRGLRGVQASHDYERPSKGN